MTSIHPLIFIIVGIGVSITSKFVTNKEYDYSVFFYIGIILAVYGLLKWFITGIKESRRHKKQKERPPEMRLARDREVYCYDCKVHMPLNYKFCPFCGRRVN